MADKEANGGELTDIPNERYVKFFKQFAEIETVAVDQWKVVHLIGYFCQKFQLAYQKSYAFKYNSSAPSKCFEVFQIKKLGQILSSKPNILKEYIDWIFTNKVDKEKIRFRSISFLTREEIVQEYKLKVLLASKIDRTTPLSSQFKLDLKMYLNIDCETLGELAWHRIVWLEDKQSVQIQTLTEILPKHGYNISTLETLT